MAQLILFGANDACLPDAPSGQHVPLEEYKKNLKIIVTHPSIMAHNPTILLVTPPPLNEVHLEQEDLAKGKSALTRHQSVTAQYAQAVREIAAEYTNVVLVDLWAAMMKEATRLTSSQVDNETKTRLLGSLGQSESQGLRHLLVDGLHLTGFGYEVFYREVKPAIGKTWLSEPLNDPSWVFPCVISILLNININSS